MRSLLGFLLALLFSLQSLQAQHIVSGNVINNNNQPLLGVTVVIQSDSRQTLTLKDGSFTFYNVKTAKDTILISSTSFTAKKIAIDFTNNPTINLGKIILSINEIILPGVEILGREKVSYSSDYSFAATKIQSPQKDIPQSLSIITNELFNDKMKFHLNEAISDAAGINLYSGNDEYAIRGFKAENAHLINGMRTFNSVLVSPLLVNIDRIEIIKGPTSILYGNADPGGNINMVSKKPLATTKANAEIAVGSYNTLRTQADLTGKLSSNAKWLYRFNAGFENGNSFRNGIEKSALMLAPSVSFIPNKKWQLNADITFQSFNNVLDRGQPGINKNNNLLNTPINLSVSQPGDKLEEQDITAILAASYNLNSKLSFNSSLLIHKTIQDIKEHGIRGYISDDSVSLYYLNRNYDATVINMSNYATYQFKTSKYQHQLMGGFDVAASAIEINKFNGELPSFGNGAGIVAKFSLKNPSYITRPIANYVQSAKMVNDPVGEEYINYGLYLQEQISIGKWQMLMGLRYSIYTEEEAAATTTEEVEGVILPRIGLVYKATPTISFFGTYNKGFDPFEKSFTVQIFKDPYKPLFSELLEAGVKAELFNKRFFGTLSAYQLGVNNIAVNANDISNPDLFIQRGKDKAVGVETELRGNLLSNLSASFTFAYNLAKIKESTIASEVNTIKENAPKFASSSWLKYTVAKGGLKGLQFSVGHSHQSLRNTLVKGLTMPGYTIFQTGLGYNYKKYKIAFNVDNLFNTMYWNSGYNYASKWPGLPRSMMIKIGYQIK